MHAKYTVLLKDIMDNEIARTHLDKALSTYPMYEPKNNANYSVIPTREDLNKRLLNHYRYREIGFETVGRFLEELEISMCEIMPYYYQLMKSEDIMNAIDDPFGNVDIVETFDQQTKDNSTGISEGSETINEESDTSSEGSAHESTKSKNAKVEEPSSVIHVEDIDNLSHATEINLDKSQSDSSNESTNISEAKRTSVNNSETIRENIGTSSHTLTRKGNQGVNTYAHDMKELRTIFLNIVEMIIHDERISELFMRVY